MKNYNVSDGFSVYDELNDNPNIEVGDTITYISNNQMGWKKYKVILNEEGEKDLEEIADYDDMGYNTEEEEEEDTKGGKRRKRKSQKKRKTNKKRKTTKRKSHKKRKTLKRKMRK